jgi:hypothetical protein
MFDERRVSVPVPPKASEKGGSYQLCKELERRLAQIEDRTNQAKETSLERIEGSIPIGSDDRSKSECESVRS